MPSFTIEAPGEAAPLTEQALLRALAAASSRDQNQIQSGTKQLQQWEKSEGFYKYLQSIFIERSLPLEVRYLAIIQLKNGIDKYWRKTATNAVNKQDKSVIRDRLISSGVYEEDNKLALQNALVIAKIVRFEYPQDWPDAISSTLNAIRGAAQDVTSQNLERALLILLYIIKELSTARIQRSRTNLQAATPEILTVLGSLYVSRVEQWQTTPDAGRQTERLMTQSLLCIKTLRRLVISGYEFPNRVSEVCEFWQMTLRQVDTFINIMRQTSSQSSSAQLLIQKHLLQLSKFHLEMAEKHAAGFVLLPSSLDLVKAYWGFARTYAESYGSKSTAAIDAGGDDDGDAEAMASEKLTLRGLLLIRACIRMAFLPVHTFRYRQEDEKEEKRQAEGMIKDNLLSQDFVEEIMSTVMTKFLVLRQSDLRDWTDEPEEWVFREENESEDMHLSVRACSERLVLDLSTHFKSTLTGPVLGLFHNVVDVNNNDILFKDAVYAAIGMAAATFRNDVDFDALLTSTLVPEVQKQHQGSNIFRRRIAIFCGQWILVKASQDSKAVIYQIFDHLLNPADSYNDQVVRITAGRHFKYIADDFEFDSAKFAPYAESIIMRLMALIEEVDLTATKMALLDTISVLIERFEHHIEPFAERIVAMLPPLWDQSGEEHLMKQSILTILARLTNALKELSTRFHAMLIPIIQSTVQPDGELSTFLLEEALDLWQSIILQSKSPTDDLLSLMQHLFPLLTFASETLRETLTILESYLYLSPSTLLSDDLRLPILKALSPLIGPKSKPDANGLACSITELMIRTASSLGGPTFTKQFTSDLVSTSILPRILSSLRSAWSAHCTTGPLAKLPAVDGIVETDYFAILSRLILADTETFIQAITYTPLASLDDEEGIIPSDPLPAENNLSWLLEEWFSHLDNVGDPSRKKLFLLALTALLDTAHPAVLGNLQLLMGLWTDVITELCDVDIDPITSEGSGAVKGEDSLVYNDISELTCIGEGTVEAPEDTRRREVSFADEVHRVGVVGWIRRKLGAAIQRVGEGVFREEWLGRVDRDVVAAFGRLGVM
ncbi:armadillo-type protein [Elsinoe ampelina]|uniref:Armadillo-type protein n=1 Tax=Elsinoe ampelina TaxID=302913 RepID=A0A6A6G770_9PEZI|nr:armadillo-type protein [Elsinoe ampelina]